MRPIEGVRFTLLTREAETPYSGMLPGVVAGRYARDEAQIDAGKLVRFAGGRLFRDEAIGIDRVGRRVLCRSRPPVRYDLLSLDIGSRPNTQSVPGAAEHAIPVKPIDSFFERFEGVLARVRAGRSRRVLLVGGGAGGVELLLSVASRLRREAPDAAALEFTLVAASENILPTFPAAFRARFRAIMADRGIAVRAPARVVNVEPGGVTLADGASLAADEILWTTEAAPAAWLAETGLPLDGGFVSVDATLRAADDVFAAGDMIAFAPGAIPRSGVYAVRAGPLLAYNIRAALTGRKLRPYRPQRRALAIVGTGSREAVLTRNGITLAGEWAGRLKEWIDRRWMATYTDLPAMAEPGSAMVSPLADAAAVHALSAAAMRCGGCGAKVDATVLSRALGRIVPAHRDEVLIGLDAPDDAAVVDTGGPLLSVHTVDYFRSMVDDPFVFGKIAANHALSDIYAMGATPSTALAIATLPYGPEKMVEAELTDIMLGANEILRLAGCALVGGHTSEGAELALGFAVNGQVERAGFFRKTGLRPGDALILTKPIGTGTLLAADMQGRVRARWMQDALRHMTRSNAKAADIFRHYQAHAVTDVTGFGLLGHLVEMTRASWVDADLVLASIPVLDGAHDCIAAGFVSSLQPANLRFATAIRNLDIARQPPSAALLFDPQTAGGLLAGLDNSVAASCLQALREAGYDRAALIGRVQLATNAAAPIRLLDPAECT